MAGVPQAGGIVVRRDTDGLSVLLVRAKKDPSIWIFPKGHIEPGETVEQAALRETHEEAGVDGDLIGPVGAPLEFQSGRETVHVQYFLILARSESDATDGRAKQWFTADEAMSQVAFADSRRLLQLALQTAAARAR
jgi:ADP-ribose pyrophosphatase YjhB (NUDIX family)